jgi:hypothetical protein
MVVTCSDGVTCYLEVILYSYNKFNNDCPLHEVRGRNYKCLIATVASKEETSTVGRM